MLPGKDSPSLEPYFEDLFLDAPCELYPELKPYRNKFWRDNDIIIDGEPINYGDVEIEVYIVNNQDGINN